MSENNKDRATAKEYFNFSELISYFFRKKDSSDEKPDFSLRSMHFVNKFSIIVFLMAIIYLAVRHLF